MPASSWVLYIVYTASISYCGAVYLFKSSFAQEYYLQGSSSNIVQNIVQCTPSLNITELVLNYPVSLNPQKNYNFSKILKQITSTVKKKMYSCFFKHSLKVLYHMTEKHLGTSTSLLLIHNTCYIIKSSELFTIYKKLCLPILS